MSRMRAAGLVREQRSRPSGRANSPTPYSTSSATKNEDAGETGGTKLEYVETG
ncbi:hypothetical protein [Natrinema salifodinae]|uniref:Uncharacterized protein n=1 Tax=Natrinema salifodinae TaxID=1202768 RepID=A0A1I0NB20_9EURY|nr:hypothetical protein [Natrinema salifodinae]SEV97987.1 hypothetical protein SAMN05216285_1491 [Natrinema salifodinae]